MTTITPATDAQVANYLTDAQTGGMAWMDGTVEALCLRIQSDADVIKVKDEALQAWEAWEAKFILDSRCWGPDGMGETPRITYDLWQEYCPGLQEQRNAALNHGKEVQS